LKRIMVAGCFQPMEPNMELNSYLLHALLIAACIPVLDVVATGYYAFSVRRRNALAMDDLAGKGKVPANASAYAPQAGTPLPSTVFGALPSDLAMQVQRLGIGFDGRQFTYAGQAYDHATDAVAYAELVLRKSNALREGLLGPRTPC
jgi:hypothetical protein